MTQKFTKIAYFLNCHNSTYIYRTESNIFLFNLFFNVLQQQTIDLVIKL